MKKMIALVLSSLILCMSAGCAAAEVETNVSQAPESSTSAADILGLPSAPAESSEEQEDVSTAVNKLLDEYKFEGVFYAVKGGEVVVSEARGKLENGNDIKIDTPMPIGSISKQFCATSILLLAEQGKLSLDDTLDKYYPEYEQSSKMTLRNLLSMRSGIPDITEEIFDITSVDMTDEENTAVFKEWLFSQPLIAEPDTQFKYSNASFILLGNIVEQVSGEKYIDFLRKNIFDPVGMKHTGSIEEMSASASWADGVTYKNINLQPGITKGAGDIISNAEDMTLWMNALSSGKILSAESYEAMTTDYTPGEGYGFGIRTQFFGGIGHFGQIGDYTAFDYFRPESELTIYVSSTLSSTALPDLIMKTMPIIRKS